MKKKKNGKAFVLVLVVALVIGVTMGAVYLISGGYLDAAVEKVSGWGEDGSLEGIAVFIEEELPPLLIAVGTAVGMVLATLLPVIARVKNAAAQMDAGTKKSVETTELAEQARLEMEEHRASMDLQMELFIEEQREMLQGVVGELREGIRAEHDKTARIEDGVSKLVRMEVIAHGASEELVKKGAASEIARVAEENRGEV